MWAIEQHATIDFETKSEAGYHFDEAEQKWLAPRGSKNKGLKAVGTFAYAEHPSTEVLTLSYKFPGDPTVCRWRPGLPLPTRLFEWIAAGGLVEAHNAMFEKAIWDRVCRRRYGFPPLPARQVRCSMARAHVNNLPGALDPLSQLLPTTVKKNPDGRRLLNKFSIPRNPTIKDKRLWITPDDDPEDGEKLYAYCDDDVRAEDEVSNLMMPLSIEELRFWLLDQEMNWRGIGVDTESVQNMIAVMEEALERYGEEFRVITGGLNPTQIQKIGGWLTAKGVHLAALDEEAIDGALARKNLPPDVRRVLEIRGLIGSASVKKLYAIERCVSSGDRVRNVIIHHGARTGRPTGDLLQPLNLPKAGPDLVYCEECKKPSKFPPVVCPWCSTRMHPLNPKCKWPEVPKGFPEDYNPVDDIQTIMATRSLAIVEQFFGDALLAISGCIRGMITAAEGKELIASDYSAIEAVVTAVLAGCQWRIETFRQKKDIYLASAAKITGKTYDWYQEYKAQHGAHHQDRQQMGKPCLGPKTQVLTDRGYLAIVDVLPTDKLWDGQEWVVHEGLLNQGVKETLLLDGVHITPDHLVNLNGFWKPARELESNERLLTQALGTGLESFKHLARWSVGEMGSMLPWSNALAVRNPIGWRSIISEMVSQLGAILAPKKRQQPTGNNIIVMPTPCPMMNIGGVFLTGYRQLSHDATIQRPDSTEAMAHGGLPSAKSGVRTDGPFWNTFRPLRVGITQLWKWTVETTRKVTNPETSVSSRGFRTVSIRGKLTTKTKKSSFSVDASRCLLNVYDLANAGPRRRFTIKTNSGHLLVHNCELGLGFGGWLTAWRQFDDSDTFTDDEVKKNILDWRAASPEIVEMWGGQYRGRPWRADEFRLERFGFEGAFINAVQYPTQMFTSNGIKFYMRGDALIIQLLSGRELTYASPRLWETEIDGVLSITYMTWNSNPKYGPPGWGPMKTYGGRICENIVQATAHDIQRFGILGLEAAGYEVILHVYDENVAEVPIGFGSLEEFERIMSTMPPWAHDWPVRASGGWRGKRYRKA